MPKEMERQTLQAPRWAPWSVPVRRVTEDRMKTLRIISTAVLVCLVLAAPATATDTIRPALCILFAVAQVAVAGVDVALELAPAALLVLPLLFGRYPGERVIRRLVGRVAPARAASACDPRRGHRRWRLPDGVTRYPA
jgi:hypothetical protein